MLKKKKKKLGLILKECILCSNLGFPVSFPRQPPRYLSSAEFAPSMVFLASVDKIITGLLRLWTNLYEE